jgi:hypothetical protein
MNGSLQRHAGRDEGQPAIHAFIHTPRGGRHRPGFVGLRPKAALGMWGALLAINLSAWLQELAGLDYGDGRGRAHLGTLRHRLLVVPARLIHHAGQIILRLPPGQQLLARVLAQLRSLPVWT